MKLSIIIPCLDEPRIFNTVSSIREVFGDEAQIVIVNDAGIKLDFEKGLRPYKNVLLQQNGVRCGSGACRHIGAQLASGDWLLHTDAHMEFYPECRTLLGFDCPTNSVYCGKMIALDASGKERGEYFGATLNVLGPDPGNPKVTQVFEANWLKRPAGHDEIPCVMGACYLVARAWYLRLSPHRFFRSWGAEEEALSVGTWLLGGFVFALPDLKVGHYFRDDDCAPPYEIPPHHVLYNRLFTMMTMLPDDVASRLIKHIKVPHLAKTLDLLAQDYRLVATEKLRLDHEGFWRYLFRPYCERFGLFYP